MLSFTFAGVPGIREAAFYAHTLFLSLAASRPYFTFPASLPECETKMVITHGA